ncbi:chromosomal replication initiator protein DnaA [Alicyclobacillaceae bacterium I2511]|nr:chromosomal replication initiator protein DnaA [Alicyclobacillaceae bacterium I2511]
MYSPADLENIWSQVLQMMQERLNQSSFQAWFGDSSISAYDPQSRQVHILVADPLAKSWLQTHYTSVIQEALTSVTSEKFKVVFENATTKHIRPPSQTLLQSESDPQKGDFGSSSLKNRYTFDSFVIGSSNRFAHAACLAVAERPAHSYNPLFIYGGVGLGKTHLMYAIGNYVSKNRPNLRILYLSSERFINEFITAIRDNDTESFRNRYRSIDVLLVDDIQFLAKKEQTQEEFFHTFNALHAEAKQIVLTSDRPPREIPTLEDRLRSRFEWGLITDIQPPDLETRIAILQRKAKSDGIRLTQDVASFIASQVNSNIRELEGALVRVMAYSSLVNEDITLDLAQRALQSIIASNRPHTVTVQQIQKVVGDHFGVTVDELLAKRRTRNVVFARQLAMYLTRQLTELSLPKIGESFGGKDHTTVLHACDKIGIELNQNRNLQDTVQRLAQAIKTLL